MRTKVLAIIAVLGVINFCNICYSWLPNQAPHASLSVTNTDANTGDSVPMSSAGSYDPDGNIVKCEYDFDGDGAYDYVVEAANCQGDIHYTYYVSGTYAPKVRVTDNSGASSPPSSSNPITIAPKTIIYVNINVDSSGTGLSWNSPYKYLHEAIAAADPATGKDEIWVAEGTYKPDVGSRSNTFNISSLKIYGGFAGNETARNQHNWVRHKTILSGDIDADGLLDADNSFHIVTCSNYLAVIDGFIITGGYANGTSNDADGAGLYSTAGNLNVVNCCIADNFASNNGAGLYSTSGADANVANCIFSQNDANNQGGGLATNNAGAHKIVNCTFVDNTANVGGGGISNNSSTDVQIINSILWGNTAASGNEIYNQSSQPTFRYCDIKGGLNGSGCGGSPSISGGGNIQAEPRFVDADNPPGPDKIFGTFDDGLMLRNDSLCINKGNVLFTGYHGSVATYLDASTDILGNQRVINGNYLAYLKPDIGAYELPHIWYVNAVASGGSGKSWTGAFKYLQDALTVAESGDQIWVAAGTYKPDEDKDHTSGTGSRSATFLLKEGVGIYGGFAGGEKACEYRDLVLNKTILSGDIDENDFVDGSVNGLPDGQNSFHVVTGANKAVLDGVTITHGLADGTDPNSCGAGLYCNGVSPTINGCTFVLNKAKDHGAAIYTNNAISATVSNCLINGNWTNGNGGTIYSANGAANSNVKIVNCTIANNSGDGISCDSAIVSIQNCILWQNRTAPDYPIRELCLSGTAKATVSYCNIDGGQTEVKQTGSPTLVWGSGNISSEPTFVQSGSWDWREPDGNDLVEGTTAIEVNPNEVTIYDFSVQFADMQKGNQGHNEDNFIAGMLDTNPASPTYKKPVWDPNSGDKDTLSNKKNFDLWFNSDVNSVKRGPINTNIEVPWICTDDGKGIFRLNDEHFFPIDDCTVPDCFGDETCSDCNCPLHGYHNWFFTLQYHTKFTYVPGEVLHFKSSDDLFVAINNWIVVDRGGYFVTCPVATTVVLENGNATVYEYDCADPNNPISTTTLSLNLQPDTTYDFDLFWAQRRTPLSALVVERSLGNNEMTPFFTNGDYRLQAGSAGIDVGGNAAVLPDGGRDFGSYPHFYNAVVDIGAWEYRINEAPVVDAGIYDAILVGSGVTLSNSFAKDDRMPYPPHALTYHWIQISGPAQVSFADANALHTAVSGFTMVGNYELQLTASDGVLSSPDTTIITVNGAPVVSAGEDQTIIGPDNDVNLDGTVSDDGFPNPPGVLATQWTKQSGPGSVTFGDANAVDTTAAFSAIGLYVLRLTVNDGMLTAYDEVTINYIEGNDAPAVEAGTYPPLVLLKDSNSVYLGNASVTDDGRPNPPAAVTVSWTVVGGPERYNGVTFDNPSEVNTTVRGFIATGDYTYYTLRLTANDGEMQSFDEVVITVHPRPWIDAGFPQTIYWPVRDINLVGTIHNDVTGLITATKWSLAGSSSAATFADSNSLATSATFADGAKGQYYFKLTGYNSSGGVVDWDTVTVTVESSVNKAPVVNAGSPRTITLPNNPLSITVNATVNDDALPYGRLTYQWEVIGRPVGTLQGQITFAPDANVRNPEITFPDVTGEYQLRLTASDGQLTGSGILLVTIEMANDCPVVDAGQYATITPADVNTAVTLSLDNADANDPDLQPSPLIYSWVVLAGPSGPAVTFNDAAQLSPTAIFYRSGDYVLRLTASDGLCSSSDTTLIQVAEPAEYTLTVFAGEDKEITQPASVDLDDANAVTTGTAPSGLVTQWSMTSGPGSVSFADVNAVNTSAIFSRAGTYVLRLQAAYGMLTEFDEVTIKAKPGIQIAAGHAHSLVILEDQTVRACGSSGEGQLGNGSFYDQLVPIPVLSGEQELDTYSPLLRNIQAVAGGIYHSIALDTSGNVWAWGDDYYGELGVGRRNGGVRSLTPVKVYAGQQGEPGDFLKNIVAVSSGTDAEFSLAVDSNNRVWAWGRGNFGQLGTGTSDNKYVPQAVLRGEQGYSASGYLENIINISGGGYILNTSGVNTGDHAMALEKLGVDPNSKGRVYTWGDKDTLGNNNNSQNALTPVIVHAGEWNLSNPDANLENIIAISAGSNHCLAVEKIDFAGDSYGRVLAWGKGGNGRLGNGSDLNWLAPVFVLAGEQASETGDPNLQNIIAVAAGVDFSAALDANGYVWTWGDNEYGQLGRGSGSSAFTPVKVLAPDENRDGQPDDLDGNPGTIDYLSNIIAIAAGIRHCLALDANGVVWAWGRNSHASTCGRLGTGLCSNENLPQRMLFNAVYNSTQDKWYTYIQAAVNDAHDNDELIAYPGRHHGPVRFDGTKNVTLRSIDPMNWDIVRSTVIDSAVTSYPVVEFYNGNSSTLAGFTIDGNPVWDCQECRAGSGVFCDASGPTITNNIIINSSNGISCHGIISSLAIKNNIISNNRASRDGDGIVFNFGDIIYNNETCEIAGNTIVGHPVRGIETGLPALAPNINIHHNTTVQS